MRQGKIFYIIGASGSGKTTLMKYAQERLKGKYPIIFPKKYVNKPPHEAERDISLTHDEMEKRIENKEFVISCGYNSNLYALGSVFAESIRYGVSVVTDGSRQLLLEMESDNLYPDLYSHFRPVFIEVDSETVKERLYIRAREGPEGVQKRVRRIGRFNRAKELSLKVIDNSGDPEDAGEELVEFLMEESMF